ncbi:hypothetical protein ACHQM5_014474 [Ranunculus cassubicifolius]
MAEKKVTVFVFAAMLVSFSMTNAQNLLPQPAPGVQKGIELGNCLMGCEVKCLNCLAMCTIVKGSGPFVCLMDCKGDSLKCIAKCSSGGDGCSPPPPPPCKGWFCPPSSRR